ncbi:uncharacterized protein NECHADRAFT_83183 [Fusarium vanettenii 77-13-4]|uniref:Uncharacterized protein n=1 Tax=Fusarium vanettenii (strain ATCC MYA-4622 / CBS 123669 / FGSC 9596 / NRRL 45880 / 77-13-4) TaxID=660122 RepID=C7ZBH5_FUSV7|nr:uncharacterized protein NECHADRAFT_83183 [Fusarium vanettenii 77-13-4]EEU38738.1 predicted protein [Fusarium vanettenii 77-13-4]
MFSRPVLPSRSWPETPQGSSVRVPSSTSAQGYMPQMFGPSQSHPPHNPSPPSNAMNDQVVQILEALNHRIISLEQQLWASQNRRAAQKNVRNSPVRTFIDPDFGELLSTHRIFDGCQRAGGSLSLVVSGQRPRLAPEREVLLMVRSDEEAEQVRNDVGRFKKMFGEKSYFYPESFYITPSAFSKDDLTRLSVNGGAKYDYCEMFKDPRTQRDGVYGVRPWPSASRNKHDLSMALKPAPESGSFSCNLG